MDFLNLLFGSIPFRDWLARFLVILFVAGGSAMLVAGLSLIFSSAATLRFFSGMNRWISARRTLRPVEIPRDTTPTVQKYGRLLGAIFIVGGSFAMYSLATEWNARAAILLLGLDIFRPSFAEWAVDSLRWILLVGNAAGIFVGAALVFSPGSLAELEARGARWYSERRHARNRDAMHLTFDDWVAQHPRASGCIVTFCALVLLGAFGLLLPAIRWGG